MFLRMHYCEAIRAITTMSVVLYLIKFNVNSYLTLALTFWLILKMTLPMNSYRVGRLLMALNTHNLCFIR